VSEKTAVAKDVTAEKTELVKERYSDLTNKAERSIQENPLTSIAIAVGAVFIWVSKTYGADAAFAVMGLSTFATALILLAVLKDKKKTVVRLDTATGNDPMAKYIPDTVKTNPTVQKLMHQVGESPITATATAVTIGMLLSRELFEET